MLLVWFIGETLWPVDTHLYLQNIHTLTTSSLSDTAAVNGHILHGVVHTFTHIQTELQVFHLTHPHVHNLRCRHTLYFHLAWLTQRRIYECIYVCNIYVCINLDIDLFSLVSICLTIHPSRGVYCKKINKVIKIKHWKK